MEDKESKWYLEESWQDLEDKEYLEEGYCDLILHMILEKVSDLSSLKWGSITRYSRSMVLEEEEE